MEEVERRVIHETLRHTKGDKTLAARLLGIAARTIYRKLEREASGGEGRRLARPRPSDSPSVPAVGAADILSQAFAAAGSCDQPPSLFRNDSGHLAVRDRVARPPSRVAPRLLNPGQALLGRVMELFFRKYFWTVNLVFILLVALLAARTVNLFVESALTPPSPSGQVSAPQKAKLHEVLASLDLKRLSDLTGVAVPEPDPIVAEPTDRPRWTPTPRP